MISYWMLLFIIINIVRWEGMGGWMMIVVVVRHGTVECRRRRRPM